MLALAAATEVSDDGHAHAPHGDCARGARGARAGRSVARRPENAGGMAQGQVRITAPGRLETAVIILLLDGGFFFLVG